MFFRTFSRNATFSLSVPLTMVMGKRSFCADDGLQSLSPKEFKSFPISKITALSHDTKAYEVSLPSTSHSTGMKVSSCILVKGPQVDGKDVFRPYTPTTLNDHKGSFELVVKKYPGGKVSSHLDSLKVGDKIEVKGPIPKLSYTPNMKKTIGMLAGGTGITPMLQVIKEILKNPDDKTEITLIFANKTEADILLRSSLDELATKHSNFKVIYILSNETGSSWKGHKGHINSSLVASLPAPSPETLVYVSGPPGFMKAMSGDKTPDYKQGPVEGLLKDRGYTGAITVGR
eukprot:gene12625-26580_t